MSNMSYCRFRNTLADLHDCYCRFRNTLADLHDCYDALGKINNLDELDADEREAAEKLIRLCVRVAGDWGEET